MAKVSRAVALPAVALAEVFAFQALWAAVLRAARGKRFDVPVARYRLDLEEHLVVLHRALLAERWRPSPTLHLVVHDSETRHIAVPTFADRVVHQCIAPVLEARHERRMIADSYACRRGHGTHAALRKVRAWSRAYRYALHLDVERYFPTIDHAVVRTQLARDLPSCPLRALCERILAVGGTHGAVYVPGDTLFTSQTRTVGLPLGSLLSQLWANRYLDPVDHFVKDRLGLRGYLRRMDDLLLFHGDRATLVALGRRVEEACHALRLRLHAWEVLPTQGGVSFVGYRVAGRNVRVRGTTVKRAMRRL